MTTPEIFVLVTGGTIDKVYFDAIGSYKYDKSTIPDILKKALTSRPFRLVELMLKDSLDLDSHDRDRIMFAVEAAQTSRVVVTHGTDTMVQTASELAARKLDKTIVFTGAFTPARFTDSDGSFNLGMAFAAAQIAPPGVYIAMNGSIFPADNVVKDRARGTFRIVDSAKPADAGQIADAA
jgi:L-asparaginase